MSVSLLETIFKKESIKFSFSLFVNMLDKKTFPSVNSSCKISSKGSTPGSHFARNLSEFGFARRSWR